MRVTTEMTDMNHDYRIVNIIFQATVLNDGKPKSISLISCLTFRLLNFKELQLKTLNRKEEKKKIRVKPNLYNST